MRVIILCLFSRLLLYLRSATAEIKLLVSFLDTDLNIFNNL